MPVPDGSGTEGTEQAGAAGDELTRGEKLERGAEAARGERDESAVESGPKCESGMVMP